MIFFFNDAATAEIYALPLHDALPICVDDPARDREAEAGTAVAGRPRRVHAVEALEHALGLVGRDPGTLVGDDDRGPARRRGIDRKSTRLNSSHANISYAVFCLKNKHT